MPHLVILYTPDLEAATDMPALCNALAETMCSAKDEVGKPVFPTGGVRVLAYPAAHGAVADGRPGCAFVYLNLRMARGRSAGVQQSVGRALSENVRSHFALLLEQRRVGITLQIDEGSEVFDAKLGNLHPLFAKAP